MIKPLIIIPTYNEELNIVDLIYEINKVLYKVEFSILVVDDASIDSTAQKVEQLKEKFKNIYLLKRKGKFGLASAYTDGFKKGIELGFNCFIQMDADFSHDPKYLPIMLEKLKDNDVVIASRNIKGGKVEGWGLIRNLISKGGSIYSKIVLNCKINDLTGGFNAYRKEILDKINLDCIISQGYCFQIEMKYKAYKLGARINEFPIVFVDRKKGKSKMNKAIFFEAFINILKLRSYDDKKN